MITTNDLKDFIVNDYDDGDDDYVPEEEAELKVNDECDAEAEVVEAEENDNDEEAQVEEHDDDDDYDEEEEEEEEDHFGPWGTDHPEYHRELYANSRVKFSKAETRYIRKWMKKNSTLGARCLFKYIRKCPTARSIFHYHHVQIPDRIDWKFKVIKKAMLS
jgi:hypothetical protein